MIADDEGFQYPVVNSQDCINCGSCEIVCPVIHKQQPDKRKQTTAFAAINHNEEIRLQSSSGGIFTVIAEYIINQNGVVFGGAFSDNFKAVEHICVDNTDDLRKLRGSKYVQSKIGDTYKQAKAVLDNGRIVLFTGTPCQIAGLYTYLQKPYDNLYTQDIICHGVPSPMVWQKYVEDHEKKAGAATRRMFFRYKKYGWKTFSVLFEFSNSTAYVKKLHDDPYMKAFLSNLCLRPSCYDCSFKSVQRQADITLADFWGVWDVEPDMYDDKGTSAVLIHSAKGAKIIDELSSQLICKNVDLDSVVSNNPAIRESVKLTNSRKKFFKLIKTHSIDETVIKLCRPPRSSKIKSIISHSVIGKGLKKLLRKG